eukprot:4058983-Prymnesium_polylepis.2
MGFSALTYRLTPPREPCARPCASPGRGPRPPSAETRAPVRPNKIEREITPREARSGKISSNTAARRPHCVTSRLSWFFIVLGCERPEAESSRSWGTRLAGAAEPRRPAAPRVVSAHAREREYAPTGCSRHCASRRDQLHRTPTRKRPRSSRAESRALLGAGQSWLSACSITYSREL